MSRFFYVKLKDSIVIEAIETFSEIEADDLVRVDYLPDNFLFKTYKSGEWLESKSYSVAQLDESGLVVDVYKTFFPKELSKQSLLASEEVKIGWSYANGDFIAPSQPEEVNG